MGKPSVAMSDKVSVELSTIRQLAAYYSRLLNSRGLKLDIKFGKECKSMLPNKIWVPDLPDDAPEKLRNFALMIMYHEMRHLWKTDFKDYERVTERVFPGDPGKQKKYWGLAANLCNIVEDPRVDLLWTTEFPGTCGTYYAGYSMSARDGKSAWLDPRTNPLQLAGSYFIYLLKNYQFEAQGFEPLPVPETIANPLVMKIVEAAFIPELEALKLNTDPVANFESKVRIFKAVAELMGDPPEDEDKSEGEDEGDKPPKDPIVVGGVVKDKATGEYEVVDSINTDGSFSTHTVSKATAKKIAKSLYEAGEKG